MRPRNAICSAAVTASILFAAIATRPLAAQSSTLAATPPMGWNSWNHFATKVTDADVRASADIIVSSGMRDAGYIYVNIDDSWEAERDSSGVLHTNSKFPDMKALADYVHSKGLKIGIYSGPGPKTCGGYAGSMGHEEQDARMYADWGIDYLKYDLCSLNEIISKEANGDRAKYLELEKAAYDRMHKAIVATGRPIVYSLCQYGFDHVWLWGTEVGGNLWRTTTDIQDNWNSMTAIGFQQTGLEKYAGPGHWNDPDMLEVGNGGMRPVEYRTHMTLWSILAAPLLAGNDLSKMTPETLSILTNKEVVAIDQDPLGKQGYRLSAVGPIEIWEKPLSGGAKAVALFNRGESVWPITLDLKSVGFSQGAKLRDLWAGKDVQSTNGSYTAPVPSHGAVLLRISK
jgi:alpha-galactosidase